MILAILARLFGFGIYIREIFFRIGLKKSRQLPARVVSVGNLTVGGAGKTPLVSFFAEKALENSLRPVVLSRGYGRKEKSSVVLAGGEMPSAADDIGDEPFLLKMRSPDIALVVDSDRGAVAAREWPRLRSDFIILDDGFQHWRIFRDIDILACDLTQAEFPELLPKGRAREKLIALARADAIVFTRANEVNAEEVERKVLVIDKFLRSLPAKKSFPWRRSYSGEAESQRMPFFLTYYRPTQICTYSGALIALDEICKKEVLLVSGIARSDSFKDTVKKLGANIVGELTFRDHHWLSPTDLKKVAVLHAKYPCAILLTTEKDFGRWKSKLDAEKIAAAYLRVDIDFTSLPKIQDRLSNPALLWSIVKGES